MKELQEINVPEELPAEKGKILLFAQDYYMREGFYKTSMDTMASELRMSKKTIYKYFPSKEILIEEVIRNFMAGVQVSIDEIISLNTDAVTKIKELHKLFGKILIRFSDKWLNDIRLHTPGLWEKVDEFRTRKMFAVLSRIIEQGKKEGLFEDKPNEILVTLFTTSIRAIVNPDFLFYNKFSYTEAVDHVFDILFNGFLTKEGVKTYKRKLKEKKNENNN
jgi:AcrR family transcriptional regulator